MDVASAIRSRRSVRAFRPDPVPEDLLRELVELANWAPSAGNLQSRDFVLVRDPALRRGIAGAALDQEFIAEAPAILVVCANAHRVLTRYGRRGRELYMLQDAAAATENFLLAAQEAGLGATWVGAFDEERIRRLLRLPDYVRPVTLVPVGWPNEAPEPGVHRPLKEILHWDGWGGQPRDGTLK